MKEQSLAAQNSKALAECIAAAAVDKKAVDVVILDLRKLDALTDYFVICSGDVDQHVRAIADHIQDEVKKKTGDRILHREGRGSLNWVLLDYVDVVVHVFKPAFREYYRLEDLWGDAELSKYKDDGKAAKAARGRAASSREPKATEQVGAKPKANALKKPAAKRVTQPATKSAVIPAKKKPTPKTPTARVTKRTPATPTKTTKPVTRKPAAKPKPTAKPLTRKKPA
jgi:ribosome-associated protein